MTALRRSTLAIAAAALIALPLAAQVAVTPPPATTVLEAALKTAKAANKTVFVHFGASWCGWCHKLEAMLNSPEAGKVFASQYVALELVVQESKGKEMLQHPGGQDLMDTWGGGKAGLPFYVFLDAQGVKLADSNAMPNGGNIGFPANDAELKAFDSCLDKSAPRLSKQDRAVIDSYITSTYAK